MFYTTIVHIANDCGYKILRFWQKYQTLVPAKNSHLKVKVIVLTNGILYSPESCLGDLFKTKTGVNFTVSMELVFLSFNSSSELSTLQGHSEETMERSVTNSNHHFVYRDSFRGWGAQRFPHPEADFPSPPQNF